jgi:hypothetical protein
MNIVEKRKISSPSGKRMPISQSPSMHPSCYTNQAIPVHYLEPFKNIQLLLNFVMDGRNSYIDLKISFCSNNVTYKQY